MAEADTQQIVFEQYRLATEMADRISARRGTANGFYFTVASALLAGSEHFDLPLAAAAGAVLAGAWWLQLRSYRNLNSAKWTVINRLESRLPEAPFNDEWEILKRDPVDRAVLKSERLGRAIKPLARYAELSVVEQIVPALFAVLFAVSFVAAIT
jgi:hypothetical protein